VVKVRVTEVDVARKRIGLTMRKEGTAPQPASRDTRPQGAPRGPAPKPAPQKEEGTGAFGAALLDAMKRRT